MAMENSWNIGSVTVPNRFVLAPMAGVTDLPFRRLCKEQGAGLVCMEMVSAKAISYHNKNTHALMQVDPAEHPVSLQLFGKEPELMGEVVRSIEEGPFDIIDINMGCPVPKVVGNGEGSALLKDPVLIERIVGQMAGATRKPVTVKMRIGFENEPVDIIQIAKRAEAAGAAAIAVHARTRQQYYSGKADWSAIARIREAVKIPVIGNGDVDSPKKAQEMMEVTGCDAVMIGRAARGNPWIFARMNAWHDRKEELPPVSRQELSGMILRHARDQVELRGERAGMREMRKHIAWYTAGIRGGAALRRAANKIETLAELEELLRSAPGQ